MLNIIASYKSNGKPQRQLITINKLSYRRIVATFDSQKRDFIPHAPIWQEQIHTGEFHNVISPVKSDELEAEYQRFISK